MDSSTKDWSEGWQSRLPTVTLQAEFFLLKFPEVGREKVIELRDAFVKFDSRKVGELQEDEALRLLEYRGETKRVVELRKMVKEMDYDKNRELSFLEWCCAYFSKSWRDLHTPGKNQKEVDKALDKLRLAMIKEIEAGENARRAMEEEKVRQIEQQAKEDEERQKREKDLSQTGIKGMAAKFHYVATDTGDTTSNNAEKIKAEAAARRALKQAETDKRKAEEDRKSAEEEKARTEREAAEVHQREQEEMRLKEENDKREAEEKERDRKAKVQAKLKEKFVTNK